MEVVEDIVQTLDTLATLFEFKWTDFLYVEPWTKLANPLNNFVCDLTYPEMHALATNHSIEKKVPTELQRMLDIHAKIGVITKQDTIVERQASRPEKYMSPKKWHEVSAFCDHLKSHISSQSDSVVVVDIGSGLGYLPIILNKEYNVPVICIEGSHQLCQTSENISSASSRTQIFTLCHLLQSNDIDICSAEIANKLDELHLAKENLVLTGLHCCGDLSPDMLRLFIQNDDFKYLTLFSCCYHKMTFDSEQKKYRNFPLSSRVTDVLKAVEWSFTAFSLRLASQERCSKWSKWTNKDHEKHSRYVAFRSILDLYLRRQGISEEKVGNKRIRKANIGKDIFEYFQVCFPEGYERTVVDELYKEYSDYFKYIEIFLFLQMLIQPLLEFLMLFDRLAFLHENGLPNSEVVKIFDASISPRCMAIVSRRTNR